MEDNRKIRKLDDRQKSREKLPVWYGSVDNYPHGLKEILANASDEIINNFENGKITVTLHEDMKTISVQDTGRGIPLLDETDGDKNYELLFETLFAGTKYEVTDDTNTGTNGVGTTVLNYTSILFKVDSRANGEQVVLTYTNGGQDPEVIKGFCDKDDHGTTFTFQLDPEVYPNTTFTHGEVLDIARRYAVSSNKITVEIKHLDMSETFHYKSIEEYYESIINNDETAPRLVIPSTLSEEGGEKTTVEVVLSTTVEPVQEAYLNMTYLQNEGKINTGVIEGVAKFFNQYCKTNKLFPKNTTSFRIADVASSVSFVATVLSNKVEFENQTKLSTEKKLYHKIVRQIVLDSLTALEIENKAAVDSMAKHLLQVQKHNAANQRQRANLQRALLERVDSISSNIDKFTDCDVHDDNSEIWICEGDSANGAIIQARNADFQATYAIRGKILNCLKADYSTIFESKVIVNMMKILGCGVEGDRKHKDWDFFDYSKLRFKKIVIAADGDEDGRQIACLILACLYRLVPTLIREGHVFVAQAPLYEVRHDDDTMSYIYTEADKDRELAKITGKYTLSRLKGLGETDAHILAETTVDPETRRIVQIQVNDADHMAKNMKTWMEIDNSDRSDIIASRLSEFISDLD